MFPLSWKTEQHDMQGLSQEMKKSICLFYLLIIMLAGCGSGSGSGSFFTKESGHPEKWVSPLSIGTEGFHGFFVKTSKGAPEGAAAFSRRCSDCHGSDGSGKIGPNIQGRTPDAIKICMENVIYMKWLKLALTDEDIVSISQFLSAPFDSTTASPVSVQARVCTECHGDDFDGGISGRSCYACHQGPNGTVGHPPGWSSQKNDPIHFHGGYARSFSIACTTCHGPDLAGPKVPSCFSCHDGIIAPVLTLLP